MSDHCSEPSSALQPTLKMLVLFFFFVLDGSSQAHISESRKINRRLSPKWEMTFLFCFVFFKSKVLLFILNVYLLICLCCVLVTACGI